MVAILTEEGKSMSTVEEKSELPAEILTEIREATENAMKGIRDPEAMRKACERMDRTREAVFKRHGLLDIAVPAIRELRDS
jgi:hypothetical protein